MRLSLGLVLAFAMTLCGAWAKTPFTYEGQVQSSQVFCQSLSEKASPLVWKICIGKIKVKYKLQPLMGEPVGRYHVYWEIDPTLYLRSGVTIGRQSDGSAPLSATVDIASQTPAVQKAFAALQPIYPTRFVIKDNAWEAASNYPVYFMFDGGDLTRSGKGYSYNTPSSPDWDQFILAEDYYSFYEASQPLPYVPAAQAKHLYQHLQADFKFSRILDLTFSGVSELNTALRDEMLYPLTVNVEEPAGSRIAILNRNSPYRPGMQFKAGRYHLRVTHPGFKPLEKWITLDARHQVFSVRLMPEEERGNADESAAPSANDLDAMLAQTEQGSATDEEDDLFTEETESRDVGESFNEMLDRTERIEIELDGVPQVTDQNVIAISGIVKNIASIDKASITFEMNGLKQPVALSPNGAFKNKIVLFNGENVINVDYAGAAKHVHKRVRIRSTTPPVKARFTLTWNSAGSDMDLHVHGPGGQHCSFQNKQTDNMSLDVDNTQGYGPENVSVKLGNNGGTYQADIEHYGGRSGTVTLYVYLDDRLVATRSRHLSGQENWHAFTLEIPTVNSP